MSPRGGCDAENGLGPSVLVCEGQSRIELFLFYYESRKGELKTRLIYEYRCPERL
jgi:hypothetical protein